jgi:hypothetical protein
MKKIIFTYFNEKGEASQKTEYLVADDAELEVVLTILLTFSKSGVVPFQNYFQQAQDYINFLCSRRLITLQQSCDRPFRNDIVKKFLEDNLKRLNEIDGGERHLELIVEEVFQTVKDTPGASVGTPWVD